MTIISRVLQVPTPWFQIFTSPAVWGIIITNFCGNYGFYTLLTCLPTYFKDVLSLGTSDVSINTIPLEKCTRTSANLAVLTVGLLYNFAPGSGWERALFCSAVSCRVCCSTSGRICGRFSEGKVLLHSSCQETAHVHMWVHDTVWWDCDKWMSFPSKS